MTTKMFAQSEHQITFKCVHIFLVGYVEERLWWPIQSPNIGGKKKASSQEDREIRSSLLLRSSLLIRIRSSYIIVSSH